MRFLGVFCIAAGIALAQSADREIPVVTVCDVLSDLAGYNGTSIILVGALVGSDEGGWIVAECEKKLVTDGFTWPDSIAEANVRAQDAHPPALPGQLNWNNKLIAAKLHELKRTTKFTRRDHARWVVMFGRMETNVPPKTFIDPKGNLTGFGFGHLNGAPAQIMLPTDFRHAWRTLP